MPVLEDLGGNQGDWPLVSVAILAYNRHDAVVTTLSKLTRELHYPASRLELLLVDNASDDGTAEKVAHEFPDVTVIRLERNLGIPALNRAFAAARGQWCLVLDDDCYVEGDALRTALATAEAAHADLVSFTVSSSITPERTFNDQYPTGLLTFWGCSFLISRRALDRLGGFDPNVFLWGNEVELTARLLDAGLRHLCLPEVSSVHMKETLPEPGPFLAANFRLNLRHWAYFAGKLLRPGDSVRVLARLAVNVALAAAGSREAWTALPGLVEGYRAGLQARDPLRPAVSAVYRDNFVSFVNPLSMLRRPTERLERSPEAKQRARKKRWDDFRAARSAYYPDCASVIEL